MASAPTLVMQYIVLPLSAAATGRFSWPVFTNGILIHMFGVGLPASLVAHAAARSAGHSAPCCIVTTNADHAARINGLDESWKAAAARRDLDAMIAIYADDAQELLPGLAPIVGREAIQVLR